MLSYPAAITLSNRTLTQLSDLIRGHRRRAGARWHRLAPGRHALLVLAHLRNGDPFQRLGAGFKVSASTAWRYVDTALGLLAALADDLAAAARRAVMLAYVILDGTLVAIDRVARQRPYYSGKHHRHGVNVQVLADPAGRLIWASPALPGRTHDLTAARHHGLIDALTGHDVDVFADKAYQGAGGTVRTPFKRTRRRTTLSAGQQAVNRAHARTRALGERAVAQLKDWKIFTKLRCCPRRAGTVVAAVLVLHRMEAAT